MRYAGCRCSSCCIWISVAGTLLLLAGLAALLVALIYTNKNKATTAQTSRLNKLKQVLNKYFNFVVYSA